MVFLSIILCVLNIQAQSHFKLYKSEGHFYLNGEMNEIHVDSILLEAECRLDLAVGELQRNPRIQRHPRNSVRIGRELHPPAPQPPPRDGVGRIRCHPTHNRGTVATSITPC